MINIAKDKKLYLVYLTYHNEITTINREKPCKEPQPKYIVCIVVEARDRKECMSLSKKYGNGKEGSDAVLDEVGQMIEIEDSMIIKERECKE